MPTTAARPYRSSSSAFSTTSSSPALRGTPQPSPRPARSVPRSTPTPSPRAVPAPARPRARVQIGWLVAMVLLAMAVVVVGLAYLSGYARVAAEGFRQAKLQHMLDSERELQQQWRQRLAAANAPQAIEHQARLRGMVRPDAKETLTVGQPLPSASTTEVAPPPSFFAAPASHPAAKPKPAEKPLVRGIRVRPDESSFD